MKKLLLLLLVVLSCVFISVGLVACGNEENNDNPTPGGKETTEITVTFYDGDTVIETRKITSEEEFNNFKPANKKDATFINWYLDKECTRKATYKDLTSGNINLYSGWESFVSYNKIYASANLDSQALGLNENFLIDIYYKGADHGFDAVINVSSANEPVLSVYYVDGYFSAGVFMEEGLVFEEPKYIGTVNELLTTAYAFLSQDPDLTGIAALVSSIKDNFSVDFIEIPLVENLDENASIDIAETVNTIVQTISAIKDQPLYTMLIDFLAQELGASAEFIDPLIDALIGELFTAPIDSENPQAFTINDLLTNIFLLVGSEDFVSVEDTIKTALDSLQLQLNVSTKQLYSIVSKLAGFVEIDLSILPEPQEEQSLGDYVLDNFGELLELDLNQIVTLLFGNEITTVKDLMTTIVMPYVKTVTLNDIFKLIEGNEESIVLNAICTVVANKVELSYDVKVDALKKKADVILSADVDVDVLSVNYAGIFTIEGGVQYGIKDEGTLFVIPMATDAIHSPILVPEPITD